MFVFFNQPFFELTMCSCSVFVVDLRKKMQEKVMDLYQTTRGFQEARLWHSSKGQLPIRIPGPSHYATCALLEDATFSKKNP